MAPASVLQVGTHDGGVDDPSRLEVVAGGGDGLAHLDGALEHGLLLDGLAAGALDGSGDAGAHPQLVVGGVGDGVDVELA